MHYVSAILVYMCWKISRSIETIMTQGLIKEGNNARVYNRSEKFEISFGGGVCKYSQP